MLSTPLGDSPFLLAGLSVERTMAIAENDGCNVCFKSLAGLSGFTFYWNGFAATFTPSLRDEGAPPAPETRK